MWLCPDETGVDQSHFFETFEFSQADCEKLSGFELSQKPSSRWRQVAVAISAIVDGRLLRNGFCNVDSVSQTCYTDTGVV